jgi:hypothetical protein
MSKHLIERADPGIRGSRSEKLSFEFDPPVDIHLVLISNFPGRVGAVKGKFTGVAGRFRKEVTFDPSLFLPRPIFSCRLLQTNSCRHFRNFQSRLLQIRSWRSSSNQNPSSIPLIKCLNQKPSSALFIIQSKAFVGSTHPVPLQVRTWCSSSNQKLPSVPLSKFHSTLLVEHMLIMWSS